jgi:arginase
MKRSVTLIIVPYDSARRGQRMGAGPDALIESGVHDRLKTEGFGCQLQRVEPSDPFHSEIATAFDLHHGVRDAVRDAGARHELPVTISGNCNTGVIGSLAAHGGDDVGLFWFDAHSDAETPESSASGFLDGMGFSIALGRCFRPKLEQLGWSGLGGGRGVLVCAREVTPAAEALLRSAGVTIVTPEIARGADQDHALGEPIETLRNAGVRRVHVHVDLDVLDPDLVGPANSYSLPGGLTADQLLAQLSAIVRSFPLVSASVASYDPAVDTTGRVASVGVEVIARLAACGSPSR